MIYDNHDARLRYFELLLKRDNLDNIPEFRLPDGYRFVLYQSGDRDDWIEIERSAKEFDNAEEGLAAWERYYAGREKELFSRMVFIETREGQKVATATAFYDIHGRDRSGAGWLHWVAVRRDFQGKGLSKPLISHTLYRMRELGYTHAKIPTQTNTWLACKIYLDFGFVPVPENAVHSRDGWRMIRTLTKHAALKGFEELPWKELTKGTGQIDS